MTIAETARGDRYGFILFLALITIFTVVIVLPFAQPILWATLAAIMFQPLFRFFRDKRPDKPSQAAVATLLLIVFAVILPAFMIGSVIVEQALHVIEAFQEGRIDIAAWFARMQGALPLAWQDALTRSGWSDLEIVQARLREFIQESLGVIAQSILSIGGSVLGYVLAFGVGLYVSYFLLRDGQEIGENVLQTLPMQRSTADRLAERFLVIVRATIKGSVVVGIVQGTLGGITFWIVGMPSVFLFGLLMAIASLLPAVGPALIWAPVAAYLLATGEIWQGVVVIASGVFVIGGIDNVLRPILVGRDTGIPDWLILVTTLGGIGLFGLSGIVIGPLVVGLFLAGWQIFREQKEGGSVLPEPAPGEPDPA